MSEWISVKERLPEKVGLYLTVSNTLNEARIKSFCARDRYSSDKENHRLRFMNGSGKDDKGITHWMPLPSPPENK